MKVQRPDALSTISKVPSCPGSVLLPHTLSGMSAWLGATALCCHPRLNKLNGPHCTLQSHKQQLRVQPGKWPIYPCRIEGEERHVQVRGLLVLRARPMPAQDLYVMRRAVVVYERLIRRFTAQTTDYQVLLSTFAGGAARLVTSPDD